MRAGSVLMKAGGGFLVLCLAVAISGVVFPASSQSDPSDSTYPFPVPLGVDKPPIPKDNPITQAKVRLGKLLFFDKRLSRDSSVSCATCHNPRMGWTDHRPTPRGIRDQLGERNAPTVLNAAYQQLQFWDGRAGSLEEQAKVPITHPKEMDFTPQELERRIAKIRGYDPYFKDAFGDSNVTFERIVQAIASFERTLLTGNASYDRYMAGDKTAMSPEARRGMDIFIGKAACAACHSGKNFTDGEFHNLGVGTQRRVLDQGRFAITNQEKDRGAFKTPTLRNLSDTVPYMHDGSLAALSDVIDFLDKGGRPNPGLSPKIQPLGLTEREKKDLLAFLEALNGDKVVVEEPKRLPF